MSNVLITLEPIDDVTIQQSLYRLSVKASNTSHTVLNKNSKKEDVRKA